jgi:hypothetical protein
MNYEFRVIVFSKDIVQIRRVFLDNEGNPISIDPESVDLSADSIEELYYMMPHIYASLTKPPLDVNMFVKQDVNQAAQKAAELLRNNRD